MRTHVMPPELVGMFVLLASGAALGAAELKQETLQAWDQYIADTTSQIAARVQNEPFLRSGDTPDAMRRIRSGDIVVAPVGHNPKPIAGGLIHHWTGAVFIPNSAIDDIVAVVSDYGRYKDYYAPLVIDSKTLGRSRDDYRFVMLMANQSLFSRSALDGEYTEAYHRLSDTRCYSVAYSTRIQQIDDFGQRSEHRLPPDEGSGYIWRLYSTSRFEQRYGGVYVEMEVIALSRDIPVSLRWLINPIVRRVSRSALLTSLEKTRAAVAMETASASRVGDAPVFASRARQSSAGGGAKHEQSYLGGGHSRAVASGWSPLVSTPFLGGGDAHTGLRALSK
jgi:hypothetical protein